MPPHIAKTNDDLLRDFDEWLASRGGTASLDDVFASGNDLLFAGMLLKGFRKAAREAVFDRFKLEARVRGFTKADSSSASFFYMVDRILAAWSLTDEEKAALLGCETSSQLESLPDAPLQDIAPETLERAAIMLDMFTALNAIFSGQPAADDWVRKPNKAPQFQGRSALEAMIDGGVETMRNVRAYLWAEATGS